MRTTKLFFSFLACLFLSACNGSSGENEEPDIPDPNAPIEISLSVLDENCQILATPQIIAGNSFCIQAKLIKNNLAVANTSVNFSAPIGNLSIGSTLSDLDGIAQVLLMSENNDLGAAEITATVGDVTTASSYEFISNGDSGSILPELSLAMIKNGVVTNQFKQGETVQVQATLVSSDDSPLSNEIINFNADSGSLDATAKLTDSQGITITNLTASSDNQIGAATFIASYTLPDESQTISQQFNYQILDADIIEQPEIKAGHFNAEGDFIENIIGVSLTNKEEDGSITLSAGGTLGFKIALVDEKNDRILTPIAISFTSNCVSNQQAKIDEQVLTINGEASATYEDISCAGASGNQDQVIATISGASETLTLTQIVNLQPEDLGAIEFIAATPDSIVLKGTGGQGKQEISTLSFLVKGKLGNPLAQQQVTFALDTQVGGLKISPETAFTNSQGEVSTKVTSGNVPTVVRVAASATSEEGEVISTQSDLLSVNTGLADQNSISLSAVRLNPESHAINGVETQITAWLADSFNNPVPDGTTVNFTTEGGQIEPSCQTSNGSCSVAWESSNPRVFNHRITILATALGHETFFDTNGNNIFDDADVDPVDGPIVNSLVSSGFGRSEYFSSSFIDMPEAWRDDNEDSIYQSGETFIDYDLNGEHTEQDSLFNGPHCEGSNCSSNKSVNVRKAIRLIMASGASTWALYEDGITLSAPTIASNNSSNETIVSPTSIARNNAQSYTLAFADTALQTLAIASTVTITSDEGELVGQTSFTVSNNSSGGSKPISDTDVGNISIADAIINKNVFGGQTVSFVLKNTLAEDDPATVAVVEVTITSPSGITSGTVISIPLD